MLSIADMIKVCNALIMNKKDLTRTLQEYGYTKSTLVSILRVSTGLENYRDLIKNVNHTQVTRLTYKQYTALI